LFILASNAEYQLRPFATIYGVTRGVPAAHVTVQGACDMAACVVALIMLCCRIDVEC